MKNYFFLLVLVVLACKFSVPKGGTQQVISYYDADAKMIHEVYSVVTDSPGIREGPYLLYTEDGKLLERRTYHRNKIEDTLYKYYPSGSISEKAIFRDGVLDSTHSIFFDSGKVMLQE